MKANRTISIALILLVSLGLLFGGAMHMSHHGDDHGDGESDCQLCHLTLSDQLEAGPRVGSPAELQVARTIFMERALLAAPLSWAAPRGPPA